VKQNCNADCPGGSGKKYINEAHEWMDTNILNGVNPDLYGFLILVDHDIPAAEIWTELQFWSEQYLNFGDNRTQICHKIIDDVIQGMFQLLLPACCMYR